MPRRFLFLLPTLLLLCPAGAARAQVPAACQNRPPSDPAYYADMKEMPAGKYSVSYTFDQTQFDNPSAGVVVRGLTGVSGGKLRAVKLSCVEIENRSGRTVKAVQLRWTVRARPADGPISETGEVLARGTVPAFGVEIPSGVRQKVEVHGAHFADFIRPMAEAGEITGGLHLSIGVARVEYADGTAEDLP